MFKFGGLRDRQRDYIDWVMKASLQEGVEQAVVQTDAAATLLAAELKTPLQIGQHLVRAFEAVHEVGAKPVDVDMIEAVLSRRIEDLEPRLTRNGYDLRSLVEKFDAKPAQVRACFTIATSSPSAATATDAPPHPRMSGTTTGGSVPRVAKGSVSNVAGHASGPPSLRAATSNEP